jgi:ornithine cyclodeaminase/alanine dehydrogenase-like protein (mu-crystallin family)
MRPVFRIIKKRESRRFYEEITIYESVGFAAMDMAVAATAYHKAPALKLGTRKDW